MAEEKSKIIYNPAKALKNPKHEAFVQNLIAGMARSEAYNKAGYKQSKDNARKSAETLISTNKDVRDRYEYLIDIRNKELEKKGIISREQMMSSALYMMRVAMGKEKTKTLVKDKEGAYVYEDYVHDVKAFSGIWDKIMLAMNYYPKESKEVELTINKPNKEMITNTLSKFRGVKR